MHPAPASLGHHIRRTLVLAGPMILTRVGLVLMSTVDVLVLGRAGAEALAAYVLGLAIYDSLIAVTVGLLLGVPVLVARETGAGRDAMAGAVWRRGLIIAALLGTVLAGMLQFTGSLYRWTGQEPALAEAAGAVTAILGLALPGLALYYVSAAFLEALHRPMLGFVAVLIGNALNLGLNVLFAFGLGLGAIGVALATALTFALLAAGLALYILRGFPGRVRYGIAAPADETAPRPLEQLRIGLASGASFLFEAGAFTVMTLFIGWLGAVALAAHGVLFQYIALTFMVAFGIAGATQVRVGNAWGRGDPGGMAAAGWTGLGLALALTGSAALLYSALPETSLRLFTDDVRVIATALPVFAWMTLALVFDGGQSVMNNACRGRGDTWVPTALHFGSYWLVMVPSAYAFAFAGGNALSGIYQAIALASAVSLGVLTLRFAVLTRGTPSPRSRPSSPDEATR